MQPIIKKNARDQLKALPPREQERIKAHIAGLPYEPSTWKPLGDEGEGLYAADVGRHKITFLGEKRAGIALAAKVHVLDINSAFYMEIDEAEATLAFELDSERLAEVKRRLQEQGIGEPDWPAIARLLRELIGR